MSKYNALWDDVRQRGEKPFRLTVDEIGNIVGVPLDHFFLTCKKELAAYGHQVGKISMKKQTVLFSKIDRPTTWQKENAHRFLHTQSAAGIFLRFGFRALFSIFLYQLSVRRYAFCSAVMR